MLLFAVFDDAGPALKWPLRHAYLVGTDDMVLAGEVRAERGLIRCERRQEGACGLGVQFPVAGATKSEEHLITLRTCLLPQRTAPYLLSLELARHRLMLVLNKLEEWAFFDLAADDPLMVKVEETRRAFTSALLMQREAAATTGATGGASAPGLTQWFTPRADAAARAALALGIEASSLLATRQAGVQHQRRISGETARAAALAPPPNAITDHEARASRAAALGTPGMLLPDVPRVSVAVNPALFTPELTQVVQNTCDFLQTPMRWVDMEPTEGKYAFARTDRWLEWAVIKAKMPVTAGPLIELRQGVVPDFLYIWEHDYETLKEVIFEHCKNLVTRYRKAVNTWIVASSMQCGGAFKLSYEQVIDLTRTCVLLVRKLQPTAQVVIEIAQPWGEYNSGPAPANKDAGGPSWKSIPPTLYAELLNQLGLNIDALGVRIQMGQDAPGRSTRDPMAISALLDRYAALDRPLAVTCVGAPSRPHAVQSSRDEGAGVLADPGRWRAPWSPKAQAEWLASVASVIAGKPYVQSLCWQELYDLDGLSPTGAPGSTAAAAAAGEMPGGGLLNPDGSPKPALAALQALRTTLREKRALA